MTENEVTVDDAFLSNGTTASPVDVSDCPNYTDEDERNVEVFSFWVEGVSQTTVCLLGIVGNILASVILTRKEMRNAFNLLLVTMACFDSTYLFGSILESFRKQFQLATRWTTVALKAATRFYFF